MDDLTKLIGAKKEEDFLADTEIGTLPPDAHSEEDVDDMLATMRTRGLDVITESELHLPYAVEQTFAKATEEEVDLDLRFRRGPARESRRQRVLPAVRRSRVVGGRRRLPSQGP